MLELTAWSSAEETFWIYLMKLPCGELPAEALYWSYLFELPDGAA
jgi:hypothetical protein